MSVAIRAITRVQDADDFGSTPGAGNDGYALVWDNGAGAFVLAAAGVTDHGALSGLSDDDHTGYALLAGRSGGQTPYGGTAAGNGLKLYSTSHATKGNIALGTTLTVDSVNGRVGIGTTTPTSTLSLGGNVSTATTKITASSAGLEVGMMLLIGTEAMHVSAVSGNVATVQRGALGTTAATHTAADAVYRYVPPADVAMAVLAMASHTNNTRIASGIKTESIGEYSVTYGDTSRMPEYAAGVVKKYQRVGV